MSLYFRFEMLFFDRRKIEKLDDIRINSRSSLMRHKLLLVFAGIATAPALPLLWPVWAGVYIWHKTRDSVDPDNYYS